MDITDDKFLIEEKGAEEDINREEWTLMMTILKNNELSKELIF
jgi:hypothetical protein